VRRASGEKPPKAGPEDEPENRTTALEEEAKEDMTEPVAEEENRTEYAMANKMAGSRRAADCPEIERRSRFVLGENSLRPQPRGLPRLHRFRASPLRSCRRGWEIRFEGSA